MQRCCARIAGLRTIACRSNVLHTRLAQGRPTLAHRQYTQHSDHLASCRRYAHDGSAVSRSRHVHTSAGPSTHDSPNLDHDALVGADNDTFDTLDSGLRGRSRQAAIRHQNASRPGGFAYIHPSKLPPIQHRHKIAYWMPAIEAALPRRLRESGARRMTHDSYSAQDICRLIHISSSTYDLDLLDYLTSVLSRPKAAVWLASMVITHLQKPDLLAPRDTNVWKTCLPSSTSLSTYTLDQDPVQLNLPLHNPENDLSSTPSLDHLTAELHPLHEPLPELLRHETLGQVWLSLAAMITRDATSATKAKANQAIKPEILEIIAMLHHSGAMPSTIYSYSPPNDPVSLCQPPTLHLLSNQIITSLTDAAWRAHETNVVEDAKQKGGFYKSLRPEIPGSMYKVRVAGLGHEVWLELVLWAMLYGRFYKQGVTALKRLSQLSNDNEWSVLSWRELANPIIQSGQEKSINWDEVKYIFNTGISDTDQTNNKKKVQRTVSAEVIASFVDAAVSHVSAGVGSRGLSAENPGRFIKQMKLFLGRNNMSLGYTSWDAIILRFFESRGVDFEKDPQLAGNISSATSRFGDDISTANAPTRDQLWQPTPAYVLDGSAASIGYYHRLLRAHIKLGSLPGAMGVVKDLQKLTDLNKQNSIQEFFAKQQDAMTQDEDDETSEFGFHGRYGGIHYPSFFPQIPVPILADLVHLVVDSQALEVGSWLLYSDDLDGPLVHKGLYTDPIMAAPLIRLAASLSDEVLMAEILKHQKGHSQTDHSEKVLDEILDQQVEAGNWPLVDKALESFARLPGYSISTHTAATMVRVILREAKSCIGDLSALKNSPSAKAFRKMSSFRTRGVIRGKRGYEKHDIFELGSRVWRLLAVINDDWRAYAWKVYPNMAGYNHVSFIPRAFNRILSGVVDTYGSAAGKQYLGKFWPDSLEEEPSSVSGADNNPGGVPRMPESRQSAPILTSPYSDEIRGEHRIHIQGPGDKNASIIVSSQSCSNLATIRIILDQALKEADGQDTLVRKEVDWASRMMKKMGLPNSHIEDELKSASGIAHHLEPNPHDKRPWQSATEDDMEDIPHEEDDDFSDISDHAPEI